MTHWEDALVKNLDGRIIVGARYDDLVCLIPAFDPEKPLQYIVFSETGITRVEFFDQSGDGGLQILAEEFSVLNPLTKIRIESREEWCAHKKIREGCVARAMLLGEGSIRNISPLP